MNSRSVVKFDDTRYKSDGYSRTKPELPDDGLSVIKYIRPRVIAPNTCERFQGPFRGIAWSKVGVNHPTATTTDHGLATLVQHPRFSTIPLLHSINGERIIDEYRELSKLTETLCITILKCCNLETHNRAQELQIEWLVKHLHTNRSVIEKMFQTEIENARKLFHEKSQTKTSLETKANNTHKKISTFDEQYRQMLAKRDRTNKELFNYERQLAQNTAECQLLQRRTRNLDDECKYYLLKNQAFHTRQVRLRYEFDEETFAKQTLQSELEILQGEKVTNEDIRATAVDDVRKNIDLSQIAGFQPSKYYSDQLNQELQRIRQEYEKKIEVYREELHRNFELELYRFQMENSRPGSLVTKDHDIQLKQYQEALKDVHQQITVMRGNTVEIYSKIENIDTKMNSEKTDYKSTAEKKQYLMTVNQLIRDRERQLDEVLHVRKFLKQQIESYGDRLNRYQKKEPNKRVTIHKDRFLSSTKSPLQKEQPFRLSLQDLPSYSNNLTSSRVSTNTIQYAQRSIIKQNQNNEGFLEECSASAIEQDCKTLNRLLNDLPIGEISILQIICKRTIVHRLQIRDQYKELFNKNLGDDIEKISNSSLRKFLRVLLLSSIEYDCSELQRILKRTTIDQTILVEILFSRSNRHIQNVRHMYLKLFKNTIEEDIQRNRDDQSQNLLIAVLRANRPENNNANDNEIIRDARELLETESTWRVDGSTFVRLLCTRSNKQLGQIFTAYQQYSHVDIEQTIEKHIKGNLYNTLIDIIRIIRDQPRFFANELRKYLQDIRAKEDDFNRVIVSRCEIDMVQIKIEYEKLTTYNLHDHIQLEVLGNYKRALLEFLRLHTEPNPRENRTDLTRTSVQNPSFDRTTIQRRELDERYDFDAVNKRPLIRSNSERTVQEIRKTYENESTIKSSPNRNTLTVNARLLRNSPRNFVPLTTTYENT